MLTPAEVEVKVISALRTVQDLQVLRDNEITAGSFLLYGTVLEYIQLYAKEYSGIPRPLDITTRFKDTDYAIDLEEPGNLVYYSNELRKLELARKVRDHIRRRVGQGGSTLDTDPDEVIRLLVGDLQQSRVTQGRNLAVLDKQAMQRFTQIQARVAAREAGEIIGIPTGFRCFDDFHEGWQPGEAIMLIGPKGAGKSWVMMYWAAMAYRHGCKVLYLSPEMSWEQCGLRFDVLLARLFHQTFSHMGLQSGALVDLDAYRAWLESLTSRSDFICVDSADQLGFTLPSILALTDEYQPDVLVFDGIHLVKSAQGEMGWEIIKEAADGLKADAQRRKSVVLWAGQVDREGMRNSAEPVSSGAQAAYSKAAVEAANRLITLGADNDDPLRRVFKVPNNRNGREWHTKRYLRFDVDVGLIEEEDFTEPLAFGMLPGGGEI
jgi:hypothetical protein